MRPKRIIKFGGSSLADADCFRRAADIIKNRIDLNPIVVVSAVGTSMEFREKVTDTLQKIGLLLLSGECADSLLEYIKNRHFTLVKDLGLDESIISEEIEHISEIERNILSGSYGSKEEALDAIMGFGEIISSRIMAELLKSLDMKFKNADVCEFGFVTNDNFQDADILSDSLEKIASKIISLDYLLVFPGYIGVTTDCRRTTLGRGGSDYTAAILGAALKRDVEIWSDVNGIYRISPTYLPEQFKKAGHPTTIPELSYDEAYQMAAFGSKVLHKKTLFAVHQAMRKGKHIRLIIKNTFNPDHPGTVISSIRQTEGKPRGITCLEGAQLFNLYPDDNEEAQNFIRDVKNIDGITTVLSSETYGRLSFVFDKYHPDLSKLESKYESHLSRDQVLIKIIGDGLGENPKMLSRIHSALQSAENPEKYHMTIVHKSPQLLTDNTFEFLVKKRGLADVVLALYKDFFMEDTVVVGMLGLGTVGSGVIHYTDQLYSREKAGFNLEFSAALVKDPSKKRTGEFKGRLTTNPDDILSDPMVDVVLEVMGGVEPAKSFILKAIRQGKQIVTANKALLAECGGEIFEEAYKYGRNIGFEASVCAEIPIIDDFLKFPGLADVEGIEGIVNGTSNYILTRFMEGMSFEEALKIAQDKGFAEADPFMDISGTDAAQKLSILASILFNQPVDYKKIYRQGLEGLTKVDLTAFNRWNVIIKPLSMAKIINGKLTLRVSPVLISKNHPLSSVRDETNALALYLEGRAEPITKIGKGAGAIPTARSIVRDVLEVSRKSRAYMIDLPSFFRAKTIRPIADDGSFEARWYVRISVEDYTGVFGRIATILGDFGLSIQQVMQEESLEKNNVDILFELKTAQWSKLDQALSTILRFPFVKSCYSCMIL